MDPARREIFAEKYGWHMEEARPDHAGRASVNRAMRRFESSRPSQAVRSPRADM
jgi:hypothetical protein